MPGKPFDVNDKNPKEPPIFRTIKVEDFPWNVSNQYPLGTQMPARSAPKVMSDKFEKVIYYANFMLYSQTSN